MTAKHPRPEGTTTLYIRVNMPKAKRKKDRDKIYRLTCLMPAKEFAPAWLMSQQDGTTYEVALTEHGPVCNCDDFLYRRANEEGGCKHCLALRAVGLLDRRTS